MFKKVTWGVGLFQDCFLLISGKVVCLGDWNAGIQEEQVVSNSVRHVGSFGAVCVLRGLRSKNVRYLRSLMFVTCIEIHVVGKKKKEIRLIFESNVEQHAHLSSQKQVV